MPRTKTIVESPEEDDRRARLQALGLYGLDAAWDQFRNEAWIDALLEVEENERGRRSLERRLRNARIGRFKSMEDFNWGWPKHIDREGIEDILRLDFLRDNANVVLLGPNGVGKTTIAQNIAYQAILAGETVRFTTASDLLHNLATCDSPNLLAQRIRRYVRPRLLVIDEVGYLSYSSRHGDLLFDVLNRRNLERPTVVTTNKPFSEWNEVFPNSSCVVALIDRLVHKAEIQSIDGDSYRRKEAKERADAKALRRSKKKVTKKAPRKGKRGSGDEAQE